MKHRTKEILLGACSLLAILVLWQLASVTGIFGKYTPEKGALLLPSPLFVVRRMLELVVNGYLPQNIWISCKRVLAGFAIAVAVGSPMGILMARSHTIKCLLKPVFNILSPIPGVAWVPLAILWFGLGNDAAIFIIIVGSITPIVTNTFQGVESVEKKLEDVLKMLKASKVQVLRFLILPSVIPYLVTGFKLGMGFAWRVVIAAEMVGVPQGIGYVLNSGRSTGQTEITFITIISLFLIMTFFEKCLFAPLERLTGWKKA